MPRMIVLPLPNALVRSASEPVTSGTMRSRALTLGTSISAAVQLPLAGVGTNHESLKWTPAPGPVVIRIFSKGTRPEFERAWSSSEGTGGWFVRTATAVELGMTRPMSACLERAVSGMAITRLASGSERALSLLRLMMGRRSRRIVRLASSLSPSLLTEAAITIRGMGTRDWARESMNSGFGSGQCRGSAITRTEAVSGGGSRRSSGRLDGQGRPSGILVFVLLTQSDQDDVV